MTAVVVGSLLAVTALGVAVAGAVLVTADRGGRDADGFLNAGPMAVSTPGYAVVADPLDLQTGPGAPALGSTLGDVRVSAAGTDASAGVPLFIGIGPAADVEAYLAGVERSRLVGAGDDGRPAVQALPGAAPTSPPTGQAFWAASTSGAGPQQLTWTAADGRWAVVVMNADGSRGVSAGVTAGVTAPALGGLSTGLLTGGAVALLAGVLLVFLAVPRRSAGSAQTP